jgi:cytochrome c oxidase subunit 2
MMNRWKYVWRLIPLAAAMALLLAGCEGGALNPNGEVAREQLWLIKLSFFIMVGVLFVVFSIFAYVVIRFRKKKGQTGTPEQVEGSHKLEIIWTVIPFLLLIVLAVPTVMYTFKHAQDYTVDKNALHVKVTAHQFWWEFEYPELGIVTANDLYIPTGKTIALELESADVLHSFWVPELGGKQDTNPGLVNKMYLKADVAKTYIGKCAELCGASHALMDFKVIAQEEADFQAWVEQMKAPVVVVEETKIGEEIFANKCLQCHAVSSENKGLFPNLDNFANRTTLAGFRPNNEEWLRKWLIDPQAVKPGNMMPNVGLTDNEVTELVNYLQSLK